MQLFHDSPHQPVPLACQRETAGEMLDAHPPVACEKDGVALDVTVDDALVVQVGQGSQDRQADGRYLLLVHPETPRWKNALSINEESKEGTWSKRHQVPVHTSTGQPAALLGSSSGATLQSCFW